ncbi:flagellar protein FlaG [Colwellia sp. 1_MG-2023]|uniref:flagellar protein FlaG n=1 Tax=Colwellia sp. 1_MG-2023 TaxID=3062649 RepID=UPI0026E1B266|nr:flagellar protein FlaG [Colwellia sp. 1_MG-2023]MDO6444399.1 flagellar protein FlaG [Colwellia sp. 1_MG-2023]
MSVEQVPIDHASITVTSMKSVDAVSDQKVSLNNSVENIDVETTPDQSIASQAEKLVERQLKEKAELTAQKEESVQAKEEIEESLEVINQLIPLKNTNLIFEFDDIADPPIVKVVDRNTEEVIREIPPKNLRKITQALNDMADSITKTGALFKSEV